MKKGDELFTLIKTLSSREKRRFKLFLKEKRGKQIPGFVILFEHLALIEEYDEEMIRNKLKGTAYKSQFSSAKLNLKQLLFQFLIQESQKVNPIHKLSQNIKEAQILAERGLPNQALNSCRRARKLASSLDDQKSMLLILEIESRIYRREELKDAESKLRDNSNDRKLGLEKLKLEGELERIYNQLYLLARESGENHLLPDRKLLDSLAGKMEELKVLDDSFRPENIRLHFWTLYNRLIGDQQALLINQEKLVNLWGKWPERIKADADRYVDCLRGYMEVCLEQEDWQAYDRTRNKLEGVKSQHPTVLANLFFSKLHCSLNHAMLRMRLEDLDYFEQAIVSDLKKHAFWLKDGYLIALRFNIYAAFFLSGNYNKAFKWLKVMESTASKAERKDLQDFARFAEVILLFEGQEDQLFLASVKTHLTFFKRHDQSDSPESWFIKTVYDIYWKQGFEPKSATFGNLLGSLRDRFEIFPVGWELVEKWLEGKVQDS